MTRISVICGDIVTQSDCDAIVNSANANLRAGSGVCGAIHSAAGPELEIHSSRLAPLRLSDAVITPGFKLRDQSIIHVRGPKYFFDPDPPEALRLAMRKVVEIADEHLLRRIAVPAISTGVYGYPMDEAAPVLVEAARAALLQSRIVEEVRFVVTTERARELFDKAIRSESGASSKVLTRRLIEAIRDQYRINWDGIHGAGHWARVRFNGLHLAAVTGADTAVVELFAFLHDSCRETDGRDPEHGRRAAVFAASIRATCLNLSDQQFEQLQIACRGHTSATTHPDITVQTCWDADRLDLWRIGIEPDPQRLCTEAARRAEFIQTARLLAEGRN